MLAGGRFLEELRWQERLAQGREATRSGSQDTCLRNCLTSDHFSNTDGSDNFYFHSRDCIDLN